MPRSPLVTFVLFLAATHTASVPAAELSILLPLGRTAYRTDERIDVSVVRRDGSSLPAGDLVLEAAGDDGSRLAFTFAVAAVQARDGSARSTEHLHLDGRLLRPGGYSLRAAAGGATAPEKRIELLSH